MLVNDKIDLSEGVDVNKTWYFTSRYFTEINFWCQTKLCNRCDNLMQKAMSFINVAIVSVKGNFVIQFWYMSKDEAVGIMKNSDLKEKSGSF